MPNKVYAIQGIRVITVPDNGAFGCDSCVFDASEEGCKDTLVGDDSCARKNFHYERAPKDDIYYLTHGEGQVVSVRNNLFDIQCLHNTLVLFHFDHCSGTYIFIRSFSKTRAGAFDCAATIQELAIALKEQTSHE